MTLRVLMGLLLISLLGCGAGQPRTRVELDSARLARARTLAVERRAPELWQRVQRALSAAARPEHSDRVREERTAEARLWLEAAIAECERADLVEQRLREEQRVDALEVENAKRMHELSALVKEEDLRVARQLAKAEATRALERAATVPIRRPRLEKADVLRAVDALVTRTKLVLTALTALGAENEARKPIESVLDEVDRARGKSPDAALDLADHALFDALKLLGKYQIAADKPREGEALALRDLLEQAGLSVARSDVGLLGTVGDGPMPPTWPFAIERKLSRVCAIAALHAVGPVRWIVTTPSGSTRDNQKRALEKKLNEVGCVGDRFGVAAEKGEDSLSVTFISY